MYMLTEWTHTLVDTLVAKGVRDFVISPGSRSTPLAIAALLHPHSRTHVLVDERSASFFALGLTRAEESKRPVALICTSGTAATNYFSAIAEARIFELPLIILTADRPHELRGVGAPQAIEQVNLYGRHVKESFDLPLPDQQSLDYAAHAASRSVLLSVAEPAGPVHINVPLREPLVPELERLRTGQALGEIARQRIGAPSDEFTAALETDRLLFVIGPQLSLEESEAIIAYAERSGIPVLADPLSQGRRVASHVVCSAYDTWLKHEETASRLRPERIIRFGAMPTSKPYLIFSKSVPSTVIGHPANWRDPILQDFITGHALSLLNLESSVHDPTYLQQIKQAERAARGVLESVDRKQLTEFNVVRTVTEKNAVAFVSNSMPIRDLDTFLQAPSPLRVVANRGANGIDGIVSSALGATFGQEQAYLLVGDLAFVHDINGLMAARSQKLTILLINNDGGGIFSFLPQSTLEHDVYETLFGTPQSLDFASLAAGYGISYTHAASIDELESIIGTPAEQTRIIEVRTNREENVIVHRKIWEQTNSALDELWT